MSITTDKDDPRLGHGVDSEKVPQQEAYLVLSEEERSKGFVRPVRKTYVHVGKDIGRTRIIPLTEEQLTDYAKYGYTGYIPATEEEKQDKPTFLGRFVTEEDVKGGCNTSTTMADAIAETYARNPKFYGATYCCKCEKHLPVNEFVWEGSSERVGS